MKLLFVLFMCYALAQEIKSADQFHIDGSNYYISYPDQLNWYQALRFCTYNGMYLIDVRTDFENKRIISIFEKIYAKYNLQPLYFWTSGTDLGSEGQYYWASTGHQMLYTYWGGIEPSNSTIQENCVHYWGLRNHTWNDSDCNMKNYFVCRDTFDVPVYNKMGCSAREREIF